MGTLSGCTPLRVVSKRCFGIISSTGHIVVLPFHRLVPLRVRTWAGDLSLYRPSGQSGNQVLLQVAEHDNHRDSAYHGRCRQQAPVH